MTGRDGAAPEPVVHSLRIDPDPRCVAVARDFVASALPADMVPDLSLVVVMTSELVTNAVRHARCEATVTVHPGPPVRIEVHDRIAATEDLRTRVHQALMPDATATGGRGIAIVGALASRMGLDDAADGGKIVWFEV